MMTTDTVGAHWRPILDAQTTVEELAAIIDAETRRVLVDVLAQLDTMSLTARERLAALVLIEPIIRTQTTAALMAGWKSLQDPGPVH